MTSFRRKYRRSSTPGNGKCQHSSQWSSGLVERLCSEGFHSESGRQWQPGANNHLQRVEMNMTDFMDIHEKGHHLCKFGVCPRRCALGAQQQMKYLISFTTYWLYRVNNWIDKWEWKRILIGNNFARKCPDFLILENKKKEACRQIKDIRMIQ